MTASHGQQKDSTIHIHVFILPQTASHAYIEQSFLCYTVGSSWLLLFLFLNQHGRPCMQVHMLLQLLSRFSCVWLCSPLDCNPPGFSVHGKNTGVGCHALLQRPFPTQGSSLGLLHCRQILYHWGSKEARKSMYVTANFVQNKRKQKA